MRGWVVLLCLLVMACAGNTPTAETFVAPHEVERTGEPNDFLICPVSVCAEADEFAPVYAVSASALFNDWLDILDAAPRTTIIDNNPSKGTIHAQQKSQIFGFVDTIFIETMEMPEGSSFTAFSRSETGYYDFGVNRQRLEYWLAELNKKLAAEN